MEKSSENETLLNEAIEVKVLEPEELATELQNLENRVVDEVTNQVSNNVDELTNQVCNNVDEVTNQVSNVVDEVTNQVSNNVDELETRLDEAKYLLDEKILEPAIEINPKFCCCIA
jgi:uncharacterized protein YicC (UPF0701 family)